MPAFSRRRFLEIAAGVVTVGAVATGIGLIATEASRSGPATAGRRVRELLSLPDFIVAHRGGSADWPEMSAYGYRRSVAAGANALEISLARTSDGVWFGLHDATLDRTSGTTDYVASDHTWAEISTFRITAKGTVDPSQPERPYLRFETLVASYGASHTLFVDPKAVPAQHYPELLDLMASLVDDPAETFIAKGFCTSAAWSKAARARGLRTWGFYYGSQIASNPQQLPSTEHLWDLLGLDVQATPEAWQTVTAYRKKVIGHVIATEQEAKTAVGRGAFGLMVSGISQVVGRPL